VAVREFIKYIAPWKYETGNIYSYNAHTIIHYEADFHHMSFEVLMIVTIYLFTLFYSNRSSYRLRNKFTNQDIECVNYQNKCSNQSLEQVHKTIKTYVTNNHQKIPKCRSRDKSTSSSVSKQYNIHNAYYTSFTLIKDYRNNVHQK
jgi:hypothetical protein